MNESAHTYFVEKNPEIKHRGRPSKGPRHAFTVKLDPARSAKLREVLETLDVAGTDYLGPIVEAYLDDVDLRPVSKRQPDKRPAAADRSGAAGPGRGSRRRLTPEEALRRAQTLAVKINLLLDTRLDSSGRRQVYTTIQPAAMKFGFYVSRTRWQLLKQGEVQVVPDECLRALANVFDVPAEYLLHENAPLPAAVEAALPRIRRQRLYEMQDFAKKTVGPVDPDLVRELTASLEYAIQEKPVALGDQEPSFRWVATPRTDCRPDVKRRSPKG